MLIVLLGMESNCVALSPINGMSWNMRVLLMVRGRWFCSGKRNFKGKVIQEYNIVEFRGQLAEISIWRGLWGEK